MKQVIKYISSLLVVVLFVTGCAQNGGKSKVTKGCYVEKEIEFPNAEGLLGMNKSYNGKFLCATYNEDEKSITIYNLKADDTWEELSKFPITYPEGKEIKSIGVSEEGIYLLVCSEDGKAEMSEYLKDGTTHTLSLTEEGDDYLVGNHWYQLGKAENGDYLIREDWGGNLITFDGKTGAFKYNLSKEALSFNVMGNKVICNSGWQTRIISVCSVENGEILESIEYDIKNNSNCVDLSEQGVYLFNAAGISSKGKNEEEWKTLVKAQRNQFADCSKGIMGGWTLGAESFLVSFNQEGLKKYDYDPELEEIINAEITVGMGWENPLVKKAINIYQQEHKDVQVNVVFYYDQENGVEALNAQLLAGEGPDILLLDSLPIQTYIDKGVLLDLSDIASECCKKEGCYKNIIEAYKQKDGVWAIPMRFQVPMIWGKNEIIKKAQSIEELAQYKEAHPDEVLIKKNMEELSFQLRYISEPMLIDENKVYNRDKTKQYINNLQTIGVQEGEITDAIYGERLEVEPSKYKELLDFANGESNIFFLSPRNVGDIVRADGVLDARKNEDLSIAPLKINGEVAFMANGILGINKNSKHQEIAKEIIEIALGEEVQGEINYLGVPITEKDVKTQEKFLEYFSDEIQDDQGRSAVIDNDVSRVYDDCKQIWKEASLCCNASTNTPYAIQSIIERIYVKGTSIDEALDDYEESIEVQKME